MLILKVYFLHYLSILKLRISKVIFINYMSFTSFLKKVF